MNKVLRIFALMLFSFTLSHAEGVEWGGYVFFEDFHWTETVPGYARDFVDEKGLRYGGGLSFDIVNPGNICIFMNGEGYIGAVDYAGGIQNIRTGDYEPYDSTTSYYGIRGGIDLAYMFDLTPDLLVLPYVGYGFDTWCRVLDADLFNTAGTYGYTEIWFYGTLRTGVCGSFEVNEQASFYGDLCVDLLPFASEFVESDGKDINLEPDAKIGFDFEAGFSYNQFMISLFWAEKNFDQSEEESGFVQPKSEERRIGIKAGMEF